MEDSKQVTSEDIHCSFCGKSGKDVLKLISGEKAMICNECIGYCNEILIEEDIEILPKGSPMSKKNKLTPLYVLLVLIFCTVIYIALKLR